MSNTSWKRRLECRRLEGSLMRYADAADSLGSAERAAVEAHVAGCAECRRELEMISGVGALLRDSIPAPAVGPSPDLWSRLEARIEAEAPPRRSAPVAPPSRVSPGFSRWGGVVPAVALAGLAAFGALLLRHSPSSEVSDAANLREARVTTTHSPLPYLTATGAEPAGTGGGVTGGDAAGELEQPIRLPKRLPSKARVQKEALSAARRAAAEARAAAGIRPLRRDGRADPFGGATSYAVVPKPTSSPVPSSGRPSRTAPAEPRMLSLAERPTPVSESGPALTSPAASHPAAPGTGPGVGHATPAPAHVAAVSAGGAPDRPANGADVAPPVPGPLPAGAPGGVVVAANVARSAEGGGGADPAGAAAARSAASGLSPTEAVNLHARQRSLFVNYGSAQR